MSAIKAARRAIAKARRVKALPRRAEAARVVADRGLQDIGAGLGADAVIAGYAPKYDEFDDGPLLMRLRSDGHLIALPVVVAPGAPLLFRQWHDGETLVAGSMGIPTPPPGAPELVPDLVLVPFLEADKHGYRLGYGGGYYDRTLTGLRAGGEVLAVGIGFADQIVGEVPHDGDDAALDAIVTEEYLMVLPSEGSGISV